MPHLEIWHSLNRNRIDAWEGLLAGCPDPSPYMHPDWSSLLATVYGWRPCHVAAWEDGRLVGLMPAMQGRSLSGRVKVQSLPLSHLTPPLAERGETVPLLAGRLVEEAEGLGAARLAFHAPADCLALADAQCEAGTGGKRHWHRVAEQHVSVLDLDRYRERGEGLFKASARRNARKADDLGVSVAERSGLDAFAAASGIMLRTRRRQGVPPYPASLFPALSRCRGIRLFCAEYRGEPVSAVVLLTLYGRSIYIYGGSTRQGYALRASDRIFACLIDRLAQEQTTVLDFGMTPAWHADLLRFKEKWGSRSEPLEHVVWSRRPVDSPGGDLRTTAVGRAASACIRRMPLPVLAWCGSRIFKYLA